MFGPKVKVDRELYDQLKRCADAGGYSSVEEFVTHVLEREVKRLTSGDDGGDGSTGGDDSDEEKIKKRLQGLGYIS